MNHHKTLEMLEKGISSIEFKPNQGTVDLIVRRPAIGEREVVEHAYFDEITGMEGDNWVSRGSRHTDDGSAHPEMQIAIMNSKVINLIAGEKERWKLAGDQLLVDLDLSEMNLPVGQQLQFGTAILEVTSMPHNGCSKFRERFGIDALRLVNSKHGSELRLRGVNMKIVKSGVIGTGDSVTKV